MRNGKISAQIARNAYLRMRDYGRRFPWKETEHRLTQLELESVHSDSPSIPWTDVTRRPLQTTGTKKRRTKPGQLVIPRASKLGRGERIRTSVTRIPDGNTGGQCGNKTKELYQPARSMPPPPIPRIRPKIRPKAQTKEYVMRITTFALIFAAIFTVPAQATSCPRHAGDYGHRLG